MSTMELQYTFDKAAVIKDWVKSVKAGAFISVGHVILTCEEINKDEGDTSSKLVKVQRIKATKAGVVEKLLVAKGDTVKKGTPLLLLGPCTHPTVIREMCAECGLDLRKLDEPNPPMSASVSMVHAIPELRVSMEQAQKLGKVDEDRLLDLRKLVLLVDLDQTLIHTTNDNVPNNLKDVFHFQLWGHGSAWYHTRIRPHTKDFLDKISQLYELHICTFGTRHYAYSIAHQLDPLKKLFSDRILSRDECFSQNSKTANLKELFPRGDHMVCIIDDREDVWNFAPNLIHVKPYHFFRHTGDINAPPGLTKKDQDDKTGFKFDGDKIDGSPVSDSNDNASVKVDENASSENASKSSTSGNADSDKVAVDLNLSEDDESDNDSAKDEAAQDADMEESNDEDTQKKPAEASSSETTAEPSLKDSNECQSNDAVDAPCNENNLEQVDSDKVISSEVSGDVSNPTTADNAAADSDLVPAASPSDEGSSIGDSDNKGKPDTIKEEPDSSVPKVLEVDDEDDYLLYLEQILKCIHEAFYSLYDDMKKRKDSKVPDVKSVIPYVRKKVLKNVSIVFSGVVPTHVPLIKSKAFQIAVGLGAQVSEKVIPPKKEGASNAELPTTHIVAARMGTAKVNEARRYKGIHIVTPEWLWTCAERWEHVEEKLYRLEKAKHVKRNPPPHCASPSPDFRREKFECLTPIDGPDEAKPSSSSGSQPAVRKERTPSGRFMDTINPLLSFSAGEIETMANEVDDIFNESESSSSDDEEELQKEKERAARRRSSRSLSGQEHTLEDPSASELTKESLSSSSSSGSSDSDNGGCEDRQFRKRKRQTETETEDEPLSVKFRRGEPLPSDMDSLNLKNSSSSDEDDDNPEGGNEEDDWMAQALEREFLDDNSRSQDSYR